MSKDDIALFLSIISIFVTVLSFLLNLYHERISVLVNIERSFPYGKNFLSLDMSFVNESRIATTIHNMSIELIGFSDGPSHCLGHRSVFKRNKENGHVVEFSTVPFTLAPLASYRGWFRFDLHELGIEDLQQGGKLRLTLFTNGNKKTYLLDFPKATEGARI